MEKLPLVVHGCDEIPGSGGKLGKVNAIQSLERETYLYERLEDRIPLSGIDELRPLIAELKVPTESQAVTYDASDPVKNVLHLSANAHRSAGELT